MIAAWELFKTGFFAGLGVAAAVLVCLLVLGIFDLISATIRRIRVAWIFWNQTRKGQGSI
jgi:hypothetical protein